MSEWAWPYITQFYADIRYRLFLFFCGNKHLVLLRGLQRDPDHLTIDYPMKLVPLATFHGTPGTCRSFFQTEGGTHDNFTSFWVAVANSEVGHVFHTFDYKIKHVLKSNSAQSSVINQHVSQDPHGSRL